MDDGSVNVTSTSSSQTRIPQAVPSHPNSRHRCKSAAVLHFPIWGFLNFRWILGFLSFSHFWVLEFDCFR